MCAKLLAYRRPTQPLLNMWPGPAPENLGNYHIYEACGLKNGLALVLSRYGRQWIIWHINYFNIIRGLTNRGFIPQLFHRLENLPLQVFLLLGNKKQCIQIPITISSVIK